MDDVANLRKGLNEIGKKEVAPNTDVERFLQTELKAFEGLSGVSNITRHKIVMMDDRPFKQMYFPRNP